MVDDAISRSVEGLTVAGVFLETVSTNRELVALRGRNDDGSWNEYTFSDLAERVGRTAAGLRGMGIGPGDRVVLMMRNIPAFHWLDLGVVLAGATPVSIYNSSSPEQVEYLANHCGARLAIVENRSFLDKFLAVGDDLTTVETVVVLDPGPTGPDVHGDPSGTVLEDTQTTSTGPVTVPIERLMAHEPVDLDAAAARIRPEDIATIIYTSGTTGDPKGVMLSHANLMWTAMSLGEVFGWKRGSVAGKRLVSYLPMAHAAERIVSHYSVAVFGFEVSCCPEVSQLMEYLTDVRPNLLFSVPRVWEKIHAGVSAVLAEDPGRAAQFDDAVRTAEPIRARMTEGLATDEEIETYEFLDAVAFSTVRELLGLDALEGAFSSAAPLAPELVTWFRTIGVPLAEGYGMSEATGPMTFTNDRPIAGTVGPAIPGAEVGLTDDGELLYRGGNVFVGYLDDPERTAEVVDEDGWLHSGDIATIDDDGYVSIVDRKKELIITAGGKNISPANLENALKTVPLIGQAAAIGDNRPFVSALVVLDPEYAPVWATNNGIVFVGLAELARDPRVIAAVEDGVRSVMERFNNAERVKKVVVLGDEWEPDSDLLTPTQKLKRRGIASRYAAEIESMYANGDR